MFEFIRKADKNKRTLLMTCFFAFFCNGASTLMMGSVMPDLKATFGLPDTLGGLMISAHSAGNLAGGFLIGLLPLLMGQRKSIVLAMLLGAAGFLMGCFWGNPVWLFAAFLLIGLSRGSMTNFTNRLINRLSDGSPAASNLLHSSFAIGAIVAPMIFLILAGWISWQAGMIFIVVIRLISALDLNRMKLENDKPDRKAKGNSTLCFMKNPSFLILAMMMFCYLCSEYTINGWLVTFIQSKEQLTASFAGDQAAIAAYSQSMATLLWAVILVGRLFCAAVSARIHQKTLMMVASFGVLGFFAMMLFSGTVTAVTVSVAGLGFCMAGICPMIYSDAAPFTNAYPMATGMILAIGSVGAILMPTVVGALADRFGFTGGMSAILVTVLLLVVFAILNRTVRPRFPEKETED